jgi:hypothetical protein
MSHDLRNEQRESALDVDRLAAWLAILVATVLALMAIALSYLGTAT